MGAFRNRSKVAEVLLGGRRLDGYQHISEHSAGRLSSYRKYWVNLCCWRRRVRDRVAAVCLEVVISVARFIKSGGA